MGAPAGPGATGGTTEVIPNRAAVDAAAVGAEAVGAAAAGSAGTNLV
jgi:hypothetical protein